MSEAFQKQIEWTKAILNLKASRIARDRAIEEALEATRKQNNLINHCEALDKAIVISRFKASAIERQRPILLGNDLVVFVPKQDGTDDLTVAFKTMHAVIIDPVTGECETRV